jgi:hypothetical protein
MSVPEFITYLTLPARSAVPRADPDSPPIGKLLDWLVNDWTKPTVTAREAYSYGPNAVRDRETILSLARILVARGWLICVPTRRRDMKQWWIVRNPPPAGGEAGPISLPITLATTRPAVKRTNIEPPPINLLLDWLVNRWSKPTISARDLYTYGPKCVRNRQTVLSLTQDLSERGWVVPIPSRQRNMKQWRIIRRGPDESDSSSRNY